MTENVSSVVTNVCQSGEISETVVTAVAEAKGVDPLELDPLFSVVDPDALNNLFSPSVGSPPAEMELSFSMAGCEVVVQGDGEVTVTPPAETGPSPAVIAPQDD